MMKKIILLISLFLLIAVGWWAVGDFTGKENLRSAEKSNAVTAQGNQGEKYTSKMLGWLGIAHGGDPNKPETWDVINGIKVPPMPDEKENNKTIGGIDINNNGVRDDVERAIVSEFGKEPDLLPKVMEHSTTQRTAMMTQTKEDARKHIKSVQCFYIQDLRLSYKEGIKLDKEHLSVTKRLDKITSLQTNTNERGRAYANANMLVPVTHGCYVDKNGEFHYED